MTVGSVLKPPTQVKILGLVAASFTDAISAWYDLNLAIDQ